ncbi:MAG: regulatory iron-sulfur-containing complex subunit RicT [Phycisphaerae bacterium]|jgi:cell fate regulator YaaT (PSP1 superfamily)
MPILPLPQFEADLKAHLDEEDRKAYEALKAPKTMVVRFGVMKMVGEFPYAGSVKPGCGSKIVVKTHRGTELGEMLTSTCPNSGCSKSVSRKEMLQYISNSGGREYPFTTEGRVLRVAEPADMLKQQELEQSRHGLRLAAKAAAERVGVNVKIVDAEPILGGETLTFYYLSEERIDLAHLLGELRRDFRQHVELRHVGARDEARISADYERCGQYCCCKNFLKVLKPVSMKSAKTQKATLDPLKISGRCGRLMCCLRYEDQTYEDLKKNLPRKKSRVGTPEGDATVIDSQILTQLVLVRLDNVAADGKTWEIAVPVEDLTPPVSKNPPPPPAMGEGASRDGRGTVDGRPPRQPGGPGPRGDGPGGSPAAGSAQGARPEGGRRDGQPPRSGDDRRRQGPSQGRGPAGGRPPAKEPPARGPASPVGRADRPPQPRPMPQDGAGVDDGPDDGPIEGPGDGSIDAGNGSGPSPSRGGGGPNGEGGPRQGGRRRRRRRGGPPGGGGGPQGGGR